MACLLSAEQNCPKVFNFQIKNGTKILRAGTTPILEKRSENTGANGNLSCGYPSIPRIAPGVAPRIVVFVLLKS